jgi:hypothetical protein
MNGAVRAVVASGSDLYAGGEFTTTGGVAANYIAKWNGSSWSALGSGMNDEVHALAVSGSNLYAAGAFTTAGGIAASRIAKWNGSSWSALGSGMNNTVYALAVSGSDLYAGGEFGSRIAKWDGNTWSGLGSGMNNTVYALAVSGSGLYAGGSFTNADGNAANSIAKWDGNTWSALDSGVSYDGAFPFLPVVYALAVSGGDLYAGGFFTTAGGTSANYVAKWNGSSWSALGSGMDGGIPAVYALAVSGSNLYAGGLFTMAGGNAASRIAKWDGSSWSPLGSGIVRGSFHGVFTAVYALALSGSELYAGGDLQRRVVRFRPTWPRLSSTHWRSSLAASRFPTDSFRRCCPAPKTPESSSSARPR